MPPTGYITVRAYASEAQLPLQNVAVAITDADGDVIALRLTDRSGRIEKVPIEVPELSAGQRPDTGVVPYTTVNIYARLRRYQQIEAEQVQVFPDTVTTQDLQLIPLPELPEAWTKTEIFRTPPQNL
ncbi:MAG: spore cortex-lytic protein [Oscillospiraceae bacterium]|nr:spore cortex-lytic protein [Oscillospiraceae bacterium]